MIIHILKKRVTRCRFASPKGLSFEKTPGCYGRGKKTDFSSPVSAQIYKRQELGFIVSRCERRRKLMQVALLHWQT
jgi:hypothetical protein